MKNNRMNRETASCVRGLERSLLMKALSPAFDSPRKSQAESLPKDKLLSALIRSTRVGSAIPKRRARFPSKAFPARRLALRECLPNEEHEPVSDRAREKEARNIG